MKYNKQLFDHIEEQYNQVFTLSEFIYDQLIEKTEDLNRFDIMSNLDLYIQGILAKVVMLNDPKNPALFNMLKKLSKYATFYQGVNLDDWFNQKEKVLNNINKKIEEHTTYIPVVVQISSQIDVKSKTTEFSFQILETILSLILTLLPEYKSYEEVEHSVIKKYIKELYTYVTNNLNKEQNTF